MPFTSPSALGAQAIFLKNKNHHESQGEFLGSREVLPEVGQFYPRSIVIHSAGWGGEGSEAENQGARKKGGSIIMEWVEHRL